MCGKPDACRNDYNKKRGDVMGTEMLLGHIALGIYTLALSAGIFVLHHPAIRLGRYHKAALWALVALEVVGIICIFYHFAVNVIL